MAHRLCGHLFSACSQQFSISAACHTAAQHSIMAAWSTASFNHSPNHSSSLVAHWQHQQFNSWSFTSISFHVASMPGFHHHCLPHPQFMAWSSSRHFASSYQHSMGMAPLHHFIHQPHSHPSHSQSTHSIHQLGSMGTQDPLGFTEQAGFINTCQTRVGSAIQFKGKLGKQQRANPNSRFPRQSNFPSNTSSFGAS